MSTTALTILFSLAAISSAQDEPTTNTGGYTLTDDITYDTFFEAFNFSSDPDPTQGWVKYQDLPSAIEKGLVGYLNDTQSVFLGVDHTTKDPEGRASVRLESKKFWNQGLLIVDVLHMPPSTCGSWPALWLLGSNDEGKIVDWPRFGEIDLIEGVNDEKHNAVTLHTNSGCTVDNTTDYPSESTTPNTSPPFTGHLATHNCDVAAPNQAKNVGCSIKAPKSLSSAELGIDPTTEQVALPSYGTPFNSAGGGIYAMQWTASSISAWFIPRASHLYASASNSSTTPDPTQWGSPIARFAGKGCNYTQRFKNLKLIINTTFCGEWAGDEQVWGRACKEKTGYGRCEEYVRDNPGGFAEVYWDACILEILMLLLPTIYVPYCIF